jgi:hypothetical protein
MTSPKAAAAAEFLATILDPGLAWCAALPGWNVPSDDRARVELTAISGQEASWTARVQGGNGPAHGLFQFERGGGVTGVLTNAATHKMAVAACAKANVPADAVHAWGLMATAAGDHLAVAFARLLLWSDPAPLPGIVDAHDRNAGWDYYARNWRPGKPRPADWAANWYAACMAVHQVNAATKGTIS